MEDKVLLDVLGLSPSQSQGSNSFAIIIGEVEGPRRLPIIIGMFEAQAIAIEMEKIKPSRPMTHDLFRSFAEQFKFSLEEVQISDLREGVFISKIIGYHEGQQVEIDARPSDAIAIALRFSIPIYTAPRILDEAGIVIDEDEKLEDEAVNDLSPEKSPEEHKKLPFEEVLKRANNHELQELLERALAKENYEHAARIRDEINRRN